MHMVTSTRPSWNSNTATKPLNNIVKTAGIAKKVESQKEQSENSTVVTAVGKSTTLNSVQSSASISNKNPLGTAAKSRFAMNKAASQDRLAKYTTAVANNSTT